MRRTAVRLVGRPAPKPGRRTSPLTRGLVVGLGGCLAGMAFCASTPARWPAFVGAGVLAAGLVAWIWLRGDVRRAEVLVAAVCFRLLFAALPPVLSDDAYRYVWDGMLQAEGINPYRYVPEAPALQRFQADAVFRELNSARYFSVYPPASQAVFAAGGRFYDGDWRTSFFVIKALFALLELAAVLLLATMVDARALLLYAWHPLVLVEVAGQGHTEAALVFFLVLTLWLVRRGAPGLAAAALAGAVWVKLYPVALFPFLWRRFGWRAVWPAVLASVLLLAPYALAQAPANVLSSLRLYVRYFEFNAGPYYAVKEVFWYVTGEDWSKTLGPAFGLLFAGLLPVLYRRDARRGWPLEQAFLAALGLFFLCSTTIHPWYLLAVLPLVPLLGRPPWHWMWLSVASLGTYLHYVDGPYWAWVKAGWAGWLVLALVYHRADLAAAAARSRWLHALQRRRARAKVDRIRAWLPAADARLRVLDLGAGEGYVGAEIAQDLGADVVLADVVDFNRTHLPLVRYDGRHLPFADRTFDVTVLYFVLHHAEAPEQVLREALRVTRGRVIVAESTYARAWDRALLTLLDRLANRLRSGGLMRAQEAHLSFRTVEAWRAAFASLGARRLAERRHGRFVHRQAFFLLAPTLSV